MCVYSETELKKRTFEVFEIFYGAILLILQQLLI